MFEKIKALLRGENLIKKAYDETSDMMEIVTRLLREAKIAAPMLLPGPEDFLVRRSGRTVFLVGGADRGTGGKAAL